MACPLLAAGRDPGDRHHARHPRCRQAQARPKVDAQAPRRAAAAQITLSSKNYSSWSLRGWLMVKFAGLDVAEALIEHDDLDARQEILLLSPSILVPCLTHDGITVWDTLAIGEYLAEVAPRAGLLPADRAARAHCRAICGEMHSGFSSLRSALPMNLKGDFPGTRCGAVRWATSSASARSGATACSATAAVPVRPAALHGRRDVRTGGDALPDLPRAGGRGGAGLLQDHHGHARDEGGVEQSPSNSTELR
jgi:hypothetical protein